MITNWLNSVSTTSLRIVTTVALMAFCVIAVVTGIVFRNWLPTEQQITVLKWLGLFLSIALGLDVSQFGLKRFSDTGYAAAKNPATPSPVNVEAPSTVSVSSGPPAPMSPLPPLPDLSRVAAPEKGP